MTLWDQLTDAQREALVVDLVAAIATSGIPHHLRAGLVRYFSDGILPGAYLQAVLCNNLTQAVKRTGPGSEAALPALIDFLLEHAPSTAWGSREAVLAWTTTPKSLEIKPTQDLGSRVLEVAPEIGIACMAKDSRSALDLAMERWRLQSARIPVPDDPVYSFAYWLFRWSGLVTGVNLNAPENPFDSEQR